MERVYCNNSELQKVDKLAVVLTININIQYSSIFKVTVVAS